jgi:hypothetical protein
MYDNVDMKEDYSFFKAFFYRAFIVIIKIGAKRSKFSFLCHNIIFAVLYSLIS